MNRSCRQKARLLTSFDDTSDALIGQGLFSAITPIELSGPIRDPDVRAIPTQAAAQAIGVLALSPTLYLSKRVLETVWSKIRSG